MAEKTGFEPVITRFKGGGLTIWPLLIGGNSWI